MRAAICSSFGPPEQLVVDDVADPVPGPGEVVVDVHACGVNFPDVLMVQDRYQFRPTLPFTPGGEVSGVVSAVGAGVSHLAVGTRVAAACGSGGFAERVLVRATSAHLLPDGVDLTAAAAFLTTYGTSLHALRDRGRLGAGETLLVLGAGGGVGLAAVELGAGMGAEVIAAASTADKREAASHAGAAVTVDPAAVDLKAWLKERTGGRGVDVVYDAVGGDLAEPALRATAWDGRYLVIGFAAGEIPRIPLNLPLLKGCSIVGVFYGEHASRHPDANQAMVAELVHMLADGRIRPHVSVELPLERSAEALRMLMDRRAVGKVVVRPSR